MARWNIRAGVVIAAVIDGGVSFLLVRGKPAEVGGSPRSYWGFPKGLRQHDETNPLLTAFRELREETGIEKFPYNSLFHKLPLTYIRDDMREINFFILVVVYSKLDVVLQPEEIAESGWFTADEALALPNLTVPARVTITAIVKNNLYSESNKRLRYFTPEVLLASQSSAAAR